MSDTIEITLPVSNQVVVLRNYTTRKDDTKSSAVLYRGVSANSDNAGETKLDFPLSNLLESQAVYVPRLVQSIDGDSTNLENRIEDLRSEDYEFLEKAVEQIVENSSPKAREARKASIESTSKN